MDSSKLKPKELISGLCIVLSDIYLFWDLGTILKLRQLIHVHIFVVFTNNCTLNLLV